MLETYFLLFLHSCPNANSGTNYATITSNALNTYTLGEHIGREWGIGKVLKWKSMVDPQMVAKGADNGYIGLHKVLGTTVEAIFGGIYHQFVRPSFPLISLLFHRYTEPSLLRVLGSYRSAQTVPHAFPSSPPPKRHASRCSGHIPLTSDAALQERERRWKPLIIIPAHTLE